MSLPLVLMPPRRISLTTSDIPSNLKHKINGILVAILITSSATFLVNILHPFPFVFYPILALLVFFYL
jgi:hypothetical protein